MTLARDTVHEVERIDRSYFQPYSGLRAGAFVAVPILVGIATGQLSLVYTTLGALFLTNTDALRAGSVPMRVLIPACLAEAVAFGAGTIAGTTDLAVSVVLMTGGVFLALLLGLREGWGFAAINTAIGFAVGVGLPGGSFADAPVRLGFMLLGGVWALTGIGIERFVRARIGKRIAQPPASASPTGAKGPKSWLQPEQFERTAVTAAACALGHFAGATLGLPRDFWIVVTIILALRPTLRGTLNLTLEIVVGTIGGAIVGAVIVLTVTNDYLLWGFLLLFIVALCVTRGMSVLLAQGFVAPFIIILLNIVFPGQWMLAEFRVLDVAIGGCIALVVAYLETKVWKPKPSA